MTGTTQTKQHSLLQILLNYVLPLTVLSFGEKFGLEPQTTVCAAIAPPIFYGLYVLSRHHKNYGRLKHVAMGMLVVVLNGGLLLLGTGATSIILKEAFLPLAASGVYLFLMLINHPVTDILWQRVFAADILEKHLNKQDSRFYKNVFNGSICLMFFTASVLNLFLGVILIAGEAHSHALSQSVATFQMVMLPVGLVLSMSIILGSVFWLVHRIAKKAGVSPQDILQGQHTKTKE